MFCTKKDDFDIRLERKWGGGGYAVSVPEAAVGQQANDNDG